MAFVRWPVPAGGEGSSLPADSRAEAGYASHLENLLTYRGGMLVPRGRIGAPGAAGTGDVWATRTDQAPVCAWLSWNDLVLVVFRDVTSGQVDVSRVPINRPTSAGQLSQMATGSAASVAVNLTTGAQAGIPFVDLSRGLGPRSARLNDLIHTPSFGGDSTAIPTGVGQRNYVNMANDVAGLKLLAGPSMVQDVFTHLSRLWVAAAIPAGGTAADYDTSLIHATRVNGAGSLVDNAATWQNSDGVYNRDGVGPANDGDFVVGFGSAGGHLVIFKRRSVWVMYGTSYEDLVLRQVRSGAGCVDVRSVVSLDGSVLFASQLGYERFDGSKFELLSSPISESWLAFSNATVASAAITTAYIRAEVLDNSYVFVTLGVDPVTAGVTAPAVDQCYLLHAPTGAWSRLSSALPARLGAAGGFVAATRSRDATVLWGNGTFARADRVAYGDEDVYDEFGGSAASVALRWRAGLLSPGGPYETSQLVRVGADYRQSWVTPPAASVPPATLQLHTSATDPLGSAYPLPHADARPRRRAVFDSHFELPEGDVGVELTSSLGASAASRLRRLEITGVWAEHRPGRPRRL